VSPSLPANVLTAPLPSGDPDRGRLDTIRRMPEGEARRAAAVELQAMFLTQLLSAMRKTVPENDFLPRSPERSVYEGTFDREVAEAIAAGDPLGLVERLGQGAQETGPSRR
jgi:Rod binding domain-containing protein